MDLFLCLRRMLLCLLLFSTHNFSYASESNHLKKTTVPSQVKYKNIAKHHQQSHAIMERPHHKSGTNLRKDTRRDVRHKKKIKLVHHHITKLGAVEHSSKRAHTAPTIYSRAQWMLWTTPRKKTTILKPRLIYKKQIEKHKPIPIKPKMHPQKSVIAVQGVHSPPQKKYDTITPKRTPISAKPLQHQQKNELVYPKPARVAHRLPSQHQIKTPHFNSYSQTKRISSQSRREISGYRKMSHLKINRLARDVSEKQLPYAHKKTERINKSWMDYLNVFSFDLGPGWQQPGENQIIHLNSDLEKQYVPDKYTATASVFEVFMGWQHPIRPQMATQLGLEFAALTKVKLKGEVWEEADPSLNNSTYRYTLNAYRIAVKGKWLKEIQNYMDPYLSASIGLSINHVANYSASEEDCSTVIVPGFLANTQVGFSYSVGVGVEKEIMKHFQMGVGYELIDWGRSQLSRSEAQTLNTGIALHHVYTNALMFNMTYKQ